MTIKEKGPRQYYIEREIDYLTEHLMHEGWCTWTEQQWGEARLSRLNYYSDGVAKIYVLPSDLAWYYQHLFDEYQKNRLQYVNQQALDICEKVKQELSDYENLKKDSLTTFGRLSVSFCQLALPLIVPRLVQNMMKEYDVDDAELLASFSVINERRRNFINNQRRPTLIKFLATLSDALTATQLLFLLPVEIKTLLSDTQQALGYSTLVQERMSSSLYLFRNGDLSLDVPVTQESLFRQGLVSQAVSGEQQVCGMCACQGYVQGRVIVVKKDSDYQKIQQGDILVTTMTQPSIVQVFDKIVGIITDEGGMLCHAAIVAREQQIPCLLATQCSTQVFQDGDTVILDASNGVARRQ